MTTIRLDDYTYPLCSDCDHEGCTTTKSPLTVSRKAAGMERYNVHDEYMTPSEDGNVVLHADAQRALDVEREKVKFGSCEACWNLAWVLCRDDEPNAVPMKCANGTTYWRCDYCWYKQQLATLQAQLDQLATFITVHVPGEPSPTKGSLGAVDCAIHIIINLQAQLRQVEWASVPRSRYDALNKDWLEEKESARRLKEVLAQLCLEMECSRNSMFVQMAVNVRATLLSAAGKQMEVK